MGSAKESKRLAESTYTLIIHVAEDLEISVGKLGKTLFKRGNYIYVGSAKGCLESRLRRHKRQKKKSFWHIDYLLKNKKATISQIWIINKSMECKMANFFDKSSFAEVVKNGFGSSDCKCPSHLFRIKDKNRVEKDLRKIGFENYDNNYHL